jgi:hypothetical protein
MSDNNSRLQRKLSTAAGLIIVGLLAEVTTLYWSDPTSFLGFIGVGGLLVFVGVVIYLIAIVSE